MNCPLTEVSLKVRLESSEIPLPKKLFSFKPPPILEPEVPVPAPKEISPVGFSSTTISIIFWSGEEPSFIFLLTVLNYLFAFKLFIDLNLSISKL